jgi:hypothetical protein
MSEQKLGQDPAFPVEYVTVGMSKRFYAACAAMQGLISHYGVEFEESHAKKAFYFADELLKQEAAQ